MCPTATGARFSEWHGAEVCIEDDRFMVRAGGRNLGNWRRILHFLRPMSFHNLWLDFITCTFPVAILENLCKVTRCLLSVLGPFRFTKPFTLQNAFTIFKMDKLNRLNWSTDNGPHSGTEEASSSLPHAAPASQTAHSEAERQRSLSQGAPGGGTARGPRRGWGKEVREQRDGVYLPLGA